MGFSQRYITMELAGSDDVVSTTPVQGYTEAAFNETLTINELPADLMDPANFAKSNTQVVFKIWKSDGLLRTDFVGQVKIRVRDLIRRPTRILLVQSVDGNSVLSNRKPWWPCELEVWFTGVGAPKHWPKPVASNYDKSDYGKHIMMVTRGTRGDIQPFIALARGFAETYGYMVTIQTELEYRDFVLDKCKDVEHGKVRFLPSGGDTMTRIMKPEAKWGMKQKSEFIQSIMMAWSEADFFGSMSTVVNSLTRTQNSSCPVDLIVPGFTMMATGMVTSEYCDVPMVAFVLQPSAIPSADPNWKAIIPIERAAIVPGWDQFVAMGQEKTSSHQMVGCLKFISEGSDLPEWREAFGLKGNINQWKSLMGQNIPIVIPIQPGTFDRPADWAPNVAMSDFIFLTSKAQGANAFGEELDTFITSAKSAGRKLAVMTFSSMPVQRDKMLAAAIKMVTETKHPVSLVYVGTRYDPVGAAQEQKIQELKDKGLFIELARAPFDILFREMDVFIIHGGLGTTVDALRMHKPVAVTGVLLMDQRFWGKVCNDKGVGPPPMHIDDFPTICVDFLDRALEPGNEWQKNAESLQWGEEGSDGVGPNVEQFIEFMGRGLYPVHTTKDFKPFNHSK